MPTQRYSVVEPGRAFNQSFLTMGKGWDSLNSWPEITEGTPGILLRFYEALLFHYFYMCVILKGWGFSILCTEKDNSDIWDYCLLQTFLMKIMSGVRREGGVSSLLENPFWYQRNESCGQKTFVALDAENGFLQFYTSCCYFGKNMSAIYYLMTLGLPSLVVVSCGRRRIYWILYVNTQRWSDNQKHYCGRVWYVCMLKYPGAPRHT